jgi:asparagine synthase (glutamine-hydrolysing)
MVETVTHRGPDGEGVWIQGNVGLGHAMLWTTPESLHEKLPLVSEREDLVITADARIDNRDELTEVLGFAGRPKGELSDSELILGAYDRWGELCPDRLVGDFAFTVWDRRRQILFCARDPMGVKPFYYYWSGRSLFLASEIKALLCTPEVPRRLNEVMVANYLTSDYQDKASTLYWGILRLPPGHSITVGREGVSVRPYWSFDLSREVKLSSDEEYAEAFREIFVEAVRCRLRSAFPVGSLLSGGLDSSSVVSVARELLAEEEDGHLRTFSAVFDDVPESDERRYIDMVLDQGKVEPHMVRADLLSPLADLDRALWHQDEAFDDSTRFLQWEICDAAHRQNVRILLGGTDGDTAVSYGLERLIELARGFRWRTLYAELDVLSQRLHTSRQWVFKEYVLRPSTPEHALRAWRVLKDTARDHPSHELVNPDFVRRIGLEDHNWSPETPPVSARYSRQAHWHALVDGMLPHVLEMDDKVGAAFSVELRYPFFDQRLMDFCLALPPEQKLNRGWDRVVLRRAMTGSLPDAIAWRSDKGELHHNTARNLLMFERKTLDEVILNGSQVIEGYVNMDALRRTYQRYASLGTPGDVFQVYRAVLLDRWLRSTNLTP